MSLQLLFQTFALINRFPWLTVNADRTYMGIAYDKTSETFIGASVYNPSFELFGDDDGAPIWRPDRTLLLDGSSP